MSRDVVAREWPLLQEYELNRRRAVLASAALAGCTHPLTWAQGAANKAAIVLGQSAPLTGPARALGEEFRDGANAYFSRLNASGGVGGRRIELRSIDDGYEPDRCKANTEKFLRDGVFALFGYIGTPTSLAALPLATSARVPFFAPFTGAQGLREPFNRYAFHVRASYFDETAEVVRQVSNLGVQRIGVFYQDDAYGKAGLEGVVRALKPLGRQPVSLGTVARNSTDVAGAVESLLAGQPEAIVQVGAYKACAEFIRQARKARFGGVFYNVSFVGTQALASELRELARGVVVSQVMPFPYTASSPIAAEYLVALRAVVGNATEPSYSSIEGYIAAKVFAEGLRRAGNTATPETFVDATESVREHNLGGFYVDFGPNKRTGSKFVDLTILTADGRVRR
jgi:ABC-type branched-subunit amino acid transport system substrate-binding protein